jgi:monoamine oxidase
MESKNTTPQTFLVRNPKTGAFNLISSGQELESVAPKVSAVRMVKSTGPQQHVVILGGGISGLTAAYDLLKRKYRVTIIEASGRTGGRSLTLRNGNVLKEVNDKGEVWEQRCSLKTANGAPYPAYLNAGPGRIPSAHYHVLNLCKELDVDLEVYIMQSRSNLVLGGAYSPMVNRRVANDAIGYIASDLYQYLKKKTSPENQQYLELLKNVGALTPDTDKDGNETGFSYKGSQRSGYEELQGINAGKVNPPIQKEVLLESEFWKQHFYQPEDFLWQSTSFQPVGGMDMIEKKLVTAIRRMGGRIMLDAPVKQVKRLLPKGWVVTFEKNGKEENIKGDVCLCNIPIPLMDGMLTKEDFKEDFWKSFTKVTESKEFLAPTCKVGWQAERELWQKLPTNPYDPVIPIFGGISYTSHPMTQMWYPSDRIHDELGVLTGAYNYSNDAKRWGKLPPEKRLEEAKKGAAQLHGKAFADGLNSGITIAWQNIPTQKGGWADWSKVGTKKDNPADIMNTIRNGDHDFYVIGDQVSWLPGWKEGAVAVAQEVVAMVTKVKGFAMLQIEHVPDMKTLIQGHGY